MEYQDTIINLMVQKIVQDWGLVKKEKKPYKKITLKEAKRMFEISISPYHKRRTRKAEINVT